MRCNFSHRPTVESCLRISVRTFFAEASGNQEIVSEGFLEWLQYGESISSASYEVDTVDTKTLTISCYHADTDKDLEQTISLVPAEPHFGGVRWWFACPDCDRRVSALYFHKLRFSCRHCHDLKYESQHLKPYKRQERQAQRIHRELGGDGNLLDYKRPPKPKWMRQETYERKVQEIERLAALSHIGWVNHYARAA